MREGVFLRKWLNLTDKTAQQTLIRAAQVVFLEANSIVLEAGETQGIVPLLISGVVRGFLLDADGRDTTDCFVYKQGEVVMGCNPLGKPSQINMETMSECTMVTVPLDVVLFLMDSCPELLHIYNRYFGDDAGDAQPPAAKAAGREADRDERGVVAWSVSTTASA